MSRTPRWPLATKLVVMGAVFLLMALASIGLTLSITWQLEGGAAAVNEAGRMRMQAYRLALQAQAVEPAQLAARVGQFDRSLDLLRDGDPSRPLFVPWSVQTDAQFEMVEQHWSVVRAAWTEAARPDATLAEIDDFVAAIDGFVGAIEEQLSSWTAVLHAIQLGMLALAVGGAFVLLFAGYLLVLEPLARLSRGLQRIEAGDLSARVPAGGSDEFGQLADGFNRMAQSLQSAYETLEAKVREKTARLEKKTDRLQTLYAFSALAGRSSSLDELAHEFARRIRRVGQAAAAAIRWSDESNRRYLLLASDCLPAAMVESEQCLQAGNCHCGQPDASPQARVIPIVGERSSTLEHCARAGYQSIVSIPLVLNQRVLGEVDLFYHDEHDLPEEDRSLLEALAAQFASIMEGLRAAALEKEAAVAQERSLLAQELHDSIAQALAFLKIQVGLLRPALHRHDEHAVARIVDEIDTGVRESYGDVRELLLHFRTRTNSEDIDPALRTTLAKFEHQSGLKAHLEMQGHGLPLAPDIQVQVLHVIQEALSNVRKHAGATQVWLRVQQAPHWRFEVIDDGRGFDADDPSIDETHVGLRIMRERARRVGAQVQLSTAPGHGTRVTLAWPQQAAADANTAASPASRIAA